MFTRLAHLPTSQIAASALALALALTAGAIPAAADPTGEDVLTRLATTGAEVEVTGTVIEFADVPADQPYIFVETTDGEQMIAVDTDASEELSRGDRISATVEIPSDLIADLDKDTAMDLTKAVGV
jgi:hypothetical protein